MILLAAKPYTWTLHIGLIRPGSSRAFRVRAGACRVTQAEQHNPAQFTGLRSAPGQSTAQGFATSSLLAKPRQARPPKASNLPWPVIESQTSPSDPLSSPARGVVERFPSKRDNSEVPVREPLASSGRQTSATSPQSQAAGNSKANTAAQPADVGASPSDADADRRQRSLPGNASTSAAAASAARTEASHSTNGINQTPVPPAKQTLSIPVNQTVPPPAAAASNGSHIPSGSPNQTQPPSTHQTSAFGNGTSPITETAAPSNGSTAEPSQYAQKEVRFDVAATRKQGSNAIRDLLETQKIVLQEYAPGQKPKTRCPQCHGGSQHEASLAVNISVDSQSAAWKRHRATCGWEGGIDQKAGGLQLERVLHDSDII